MAGLTVKELWMQARQATADGRPETARRLYAEALALDSQHPDLHHHMAAVCYHLDDLDAAAFHFKEVTRLDPLRPGAYINLGAVLNALGEQEEAIRTLRRAIQLEPHRAEGYYNLGLAYRNADRPDLAEHAYLDALRINPRMLDAQLNLANLLRETGRFEEAIAGYREVLAIRPTWRRALKGLRAAEEALERRRLGAQAEPIAPIDLADALRRLARVGEIRGRHLVEVLEGPVGSALQRSTDAALSSEDRAARADSAVAEFRAAQRDWLDALAEARSFVERLADDAPS